MRIFLILFFTALHFTAISQVDKILSFEQYISMVREHHPVTYKARILQKMADSNELMARGGFDPKLMGSWDHKSFDDKNYFSLLNGGIKIPTWYGVEIEAGYDRNNGEFLSASDNVPTRGLWNAGISVPLGKGFVIDERRAELKRAELFRDGTEISRTLIVNETLFAAANAYLEWQIATENLRIAEEGVELARTRQISTRSSFVNGDKPAIDTLETFISLQNRQLDSLKALQDLDNAAIQLYNYLWIDGEIPLELDPEVRPSPLAIDLLQTSVDSLSLQQELWIRSHPEILNYDIKIGNLDLDRRLVREDMKPDLRVKYNPLVGVADDALFDQLNPNNFKFGATLSYPLIQRKQRGKLQLTKLKIQDTQFDRLQKQQDINTKLDIYINTMMQANDQYALLETTVENYRRMLAAENRKLQVGESSIFLVNSRESKYLDSRYKILEAAQKVLSSRLIYLLFSAKIGEVL